jgi:hypothetical protein
MLFYTKLQLLKLIFDVAIYSVTILNLKRRKIENTMMKMLKRIIFEQPHSSPNKNKVMIQNMHTHTWQWAISTAN